MVTRTINRIITHAFAVFGLVLLVAYSGCSLPAGKPVPTYSGLSGHSPYQTNYPPQNYSPQNYSPNGQVQYGAPNYAPNARAYGRWNPAGFTGKTC